MMNYWMSESEIIEFISARQDLLTICANHAAIPCVSYMEYELVSILGSLHSPKVLT